MDASASVKSKSLRALLMSDDNKSTQIIEAGLLGLVDLAKIEGWNEEKLLDRLAQEKFDFLMLHKVETNQALLQMLNVIASNSPLPVVLFVDADEQYMAREVVRAGVASYVIDGLYSSRIAPLVFVAVERFQFSDGLQKELKKTKADLADRKLIERAKGFLMKDRGLSEDEAYNVMRKMAMAQARSIRDIASTIISFSQMLPRK